VKGSLWTKQRTSTFYKMQGISRLAWRLIFVELGVCEKDRVDARVHPKVSVLSPSRNIRLQQ
jgi:hypothetical protein